MIHLLIGYLLLLAAPANALNCAGWTSLLLGLRAPSSREVIRLVTDSYDGRDLYSAEDRASLSNIWSSQVTEAEKLKQTFEVYLQARLRDLPPDVARFARDVLATSEHANRKHKEWFLRIVEQAMGTNTMGLYSRNPRGIFVAGLGLEGHEPSSLDYAILAHEFEHTIQDGLERHYGVMAHEIFNAEKGVQTRFLTEKSAMMAETLFLRAIPDAKNQILELLGKYAKREQMTLAAYREKVYREKQTTLIMAFSYVDSALDPKEYARSQWESKSGRYSLPEIRAAHLKTEVANLKSRLSWIYQNEKNRSDPDKPYLGMWGRINLKMAQVAASLQGKNPDPIKASGTLEELRASLSDLAETYKARQKQLQELRDSARSGTGELAYLEERRKLLQEAIDEIEAYLREVFVPAG